MSDEGLEKYSNFMCLHALFSQARSKLVIAHKPRQKNTFSYIQSYCISAIRLHCDSTNTISSEKHLDMALSILFTYHNTLT